MRRAADPAVSADRRLATPLVGVALAVDMSVALVTAHIDEGFFAADGGIELVVLLGGASLALVLTGAGRFSADAALDLPRHLRALGARTRDLTRHPSRRDQAQAGAKVTT